MVVAGGGILVIRCQYLTVKTMDYQYYDKCYQSQICHIDRHPHDVPVSGIGCRLQDTVTYSLIGDETAMRFFYVDPNSGICSLKMSIQDHADSKYYVSKGHQLAASFHLCSY